MATKLLVLLSVIASSSALSHLAVSPALRPSIASFRLQGSSNLALKGGDSSEFPIDAETALKINAAVFFAYGALCMPDLNLPLLDMKMKVHKTRNSMFYNDETEETESNIKAFRWIGGSFFAVAGLNYIAATEADEKTKKSVCKFAALHALCNFVLMLVNHQPVSCGGPIVAPAMAVILGMNGF